MEENTTEQMPDNAITLGDLILMHNIISTVSRRGAFEASEFQIVGTLFEKLKSYIPAKEETAETAETLNTSDEQPENQLNFDFTQGAATETATQ
jgi:hypothetical protein